MTWKESNNMSLTRVGLNLIQQAISIYDNDLKLAVWNNRFQEMFDLPEQFCTPGATFEETIRHLVERGEYGDVEDVEEAVRVRVEQARTFEPHYMERTRANGQTISVEGNPLPQGGWVTVYTDITEIKTQESLLRARSEELSDQVLTHTERLAQTNRELAATITALEETKRQLTATEARTRMTTEMMPAHIAHVDLDGHYTFSNRRLSSVMPGRPSDIVGLTGAEALGASAYAHISPHLARAYEGDSSVFEFTHDESGRRIRVAFTPDRRDGPIEGVYILSMDVTEEAQARAALIQTHKRELAAQLTSGLAHDFANLLTIILGMQARLLKFGLPVEATELISATQNAARRGGNLLDRIAQMSGPRELRPVATDISGFLNEIEVLARPNLPDAIALDITHSQIAEPLLLDPGFLQDSLLNLILNASDAIGAGPGRISLDAQPLRDTWLEIRINDTGPGFSEKALKHALDPFFTTKGEEGSGLGLSMVYDFIKSAGGQIKLMNTDCGATVSLRLPLRTASASSQPMLVLLVEDTAEIRASVRDMLVELGHNVIEAATAEEGESLAEVPGIDMILSDISLAGDRTGVEMLEGLQTKGLVKSASVMTSLPASHPDRIAAEARFGLIVKPFTVRELAGFLNIEDTP